MAMSPAKRHFLRHQAQEEALKNAEFGGAERTDAYQQHMMLLHEDIVALKAIQSREGKAAYKRDALHKYAPYLDGVLAANAGGDDDVVTTVMTWAIDAGLYAPALDVAAYVLRHGIKLPDRFKRTTGCLIAEEIAEAALDALAASADFPDGIVQQAITLTADQDMPDEVRAKLHLAEGRAVARTLDAAVPPPLEQLQAASDHLRRAIELHAACGAKKDLERIERALKKQAGQPTG